MAIHGLTRVRFDGDKVVVVAGAVPAHIEAAAVEMEPVDTPMTPVRHITKLKNKPPKFVAPNPQAEPALAADEKETK